MLTSQQPLHTLSFSNFRYYTWLPGFYGDNCFLKVSTSLQRDGCNYILHIMLQMQKAHRGELGGGKAISGSHPLACNFTDQEQRKSPRNDSGSFKEEGRTAVKCPEGYLHTADRTTCFAAEEDWGEEDDLPTYGQSEHRKLSTIVSVSASMLKKIFSDEDDGVLLVVQEFSLQTENKVSLRM